jgi:hypothetical protein
VLCGDSLSDPRLKIATASVSIVNFMRLGYATVLGPYNHGASSLSVMAQLFPEHPSIDNGKRASLLAHCAMNLVPSR